MEYPKNTAIEKRLKELEDYVTNAQASITLYKENIKRAMKEKNQLSKITEEKKNDK